MSISQFCHTLYNKTYYFVSLFWMFLLFWIFYIYIYIYIYTYMIQLCWFCEISFVIRCFLLVLSITMENNIFSYTVTIYWWNLIVFIKIMQNIKQVVVVCLICSDPWQGAFATPGRGIGAGGTNRGQCLFYHPIELDIIE